MFSEAAHQALERVRSIQARHSRSRHRHHGSSGFTSGDDSEPHEPGDYDEDYWAVDDERINVPTLGPPHVHTSSSSSPIPLENRDDRIFESGGALAGKKLAFFPIQWIAPDARSYRIYTDGTAVPVPRHHRRERFFQLALVHLLGFPDAAHGHEGCGPRRKCFPDAVYHESKLALECDEEQHYDAQHRFNRWKPQYQRPRDRAVNEGYTRLGYYVVRVMACDGPFNNWWPERNFRFDAVSPLETYLRTLRGVRRVLEERRRNYARGDFAGKIIVVGKDADEERYGREYMEADSIERDTARGAPELTELGRAAMRGTILAQELAMLRAEAFLRHQEELSTLSVPSTAAAGLSLNDVFSSTLKIGSRYEEHWRALLDSYDSERHYQERIVRIERDLQLRNAAVTASS